MIRMFDIIVASVALIVLAVPMILLGILIAIRLGRPVFFVQPRPGKGGQPFKMIKFRSMTDEKDQNGILLPDEKRLTRFGKALRASSLDELPELINVVKGDMSLVGPRPLLVRYLDLYSPEQARRHDVRPGITGWAQINGRNAITWPEKFALDVWYVDNLSLWLNIKILYLTIGRVLGRSDVSADQSATMPEFRGEQ